MMDQTTKIIRDYYNASVEREWNRIADRPEFLLTCRMLDRYIQPGDTVLDIGGGPGRYALYLADKGCGVTLLDLSGENTKFTSRRAAEQGLSIKTVTGDAREADTLVEGSYNHVLLMGPMYHLLEEADRITAVNAALRLLKPGGILYISFINAFAGIIYYMKHMPDMSADAGGEEFIKKVIAGQSFSGDAFTKAFFIDSREVLPFMERFPLEKMHYFGQEGVTGPCEMNIMGQSREVIGMWLDLSVAVWEREDLLNYSEHLMYVGRKKMDIQFIFPTAKHKQAVLEYKQEHINCGERHIHGSGSLMQAEDFDKWLDKVTTFQYNPPEGLVKGSTYLAFYGTQMVGMLQIRHTLNAELLQSGGHIGYGVRPSERRKGYASQMLALALEKCRELGIGKALVTCDKDNIASSKTILKNGGLLENEMAEADGNILQRYWITL